MRHFVNRRLVASLLGTLVGLSSGCGRLHGQAAPGFDTLRPSTAPAFTLLDLSPSAVERPTTPADLALSLVNRTELLSRIPNDFALEASPYWLQTRPRLDWRSDTTRSLTRSIARTLAFSAGSAQIGTEEAPVTGVAVGARMLLLSGRIARESRDSLHVVEARLAELSALIQREVLARTTDLTDAFTRQLRETDTIPEPARSEARRRFTEEYTRARGGVEELVLASPEVRQVREELGRATNGLAIAREGLTVELAGGGSWAFPNRSWEGRGLHRGGAWLVASWERASIGGGAELTPIVVGRFLAGGDTVPDAADAGLRLLLHSPRYSFSVEGVYRRALGDVAGDRDLYRVAGIVEYQMFPDTWVVGTFGRDQTTPSAGSLLAQIGFKAQFSGERYRAGPG